MQEVLGSSFVNRDGEVPFAELEKCPIVALYFTASWCPPCRVFNPMLVEFYNDVNYPHKRLEIIQISSDKDATAFLEYFSRAPWLAVPYGDPRIKAIKSSYRVEGIPLLLLLNRDGSMLHGTAREDVQNEGPNCFEKWLKLIN